MAERKQAVTQIEIRCAYCFDVTQTPIHGGKRKGDQKPFCDPDCLDLFKRLNEDGPKKLRAKLSNSGIVVVRRHQGTTPAQQERLGDIDQENSGPDPDKKGPRMRRDKGSLYRREE